jgi:hypothetical protein
MDMLNLYLEQANRTGYCIMNEVDFVILPLDVYAELLKINGVNETLNLYYKNKQSE